MQIKLKSVKFGKIRQAKYFRPNHFGKRPNVHHLVSRRPSSELR